MNNTLSTMQTVAGLIQNRDIAVTDRPKPLLKTSLFYVNVGVFALALIALCVFWFTLDKMGLPPERRAELWLQAFQSFLKVAAVGGGALSLRSLMNTFFKNSTQRKLVEAILGVPSAIENVAGDVTVNAPAQQAPAVPPQQAQPEPLPDYSAQPVAMEGEPVESWQDAIAESPTPDTPVTEPQAQPPGFVSDIATIYARELATRGAAVVNQELNQIFEKHIQGVIKP